MSLTIKNDRSVFLTKDVFVQTLYQFLRSQNVSPLPPISEISVEFLKSSTELSAAPSNTDVVKIKWST